MKNRRRYAPAVFAFTFYLTPALVKGPKYPVGLTPIDDWYFLSAWSVRGPNIPVVFPGARKPLDIRRDWSVDTSVPLSWSCISLLNEDDDIPVGVAVMIARAASILLAGTIPALMRVSMNEESVGVDTGWEAVICVCPENPVNIPPTRDARLAATRRADAPVRETVSVMTDVVHEDVVNERIEPYEVPVMFVAYGRK
jgi:hypothetical protein